MKTKLLDHGSLALVDSMGNDKAIVDAARVSISGEGVKATSSDEKLIRYLWKNKHTTPFEAVELKFHVKCPIFIARQWMRHRTFSYNEVSARYSELPEEYYIPKHADIRQQSDHNKQCSGVGLDKARQHLIQGVIERCTEACWSGYKAALAAGVARETARMVLPLNTYTQFMTKGNLRNWLHFVSLRDHEHAQMEIRVYAEAMSKMIERVCPLAWAAYKES